jgi:hypothetical protein
MRSRSTVAAACAAVAATTVAALMSASPALAIDNGVPDGTNHPNAGLLAIEHDGVKDAWCSGFYAGPHKANPGIGVYVTAAHCIAQLSQFGFSGADLSVTFEPDIAIEIDGETWATTAATWHPAFAYATAADADYGVVLLEDPVAGAAGVKFPRARLLDDLNERGTLRPATVFDNIGYGIIPTFKGGPVHYEPTTGRMFSTSKFVGLTKTHLHLLTNSDAGYGGACYGDSGAPVLRHDSNTAVALTAGGDAICRAQNHPLRLDIPAARAFYGNYLELP